jgi:SAM-dependent methyltransferase
MQSIRSGIGATFASRGSARPNYSQACIDWLFEQAHVRPGCKVLHVFTSAGYLLSQLHALGVAITAVEADPQIRANLQSNFPDIDIRNGTPDALPVDDESFDAVLVGNTFQWFHPEAALAEFHRVLRRNGHLGVLYNRRCPTDPGQKDVARILHARTKPFDWREGDWRGMLAASARFSPGKQLSDRFVFDCDEELLVQHVKTIGFVAIADMAVQSSIEADVRGLVKARRGMIRLIYDTIAIASMRENGTSLDVDA